jgi:Esterase Ig-like N-terminal domain
MVSGGALLSVTLTAYAQERTGHMLGATAVTQVFGDGVRLTAIALEYHEPIAASGLSPSAFTVEGRTVTEVFVSTSADPADRADAGRFVIVALSPKDEGALLAERVRPQGGGEGGPPLAAAPARRATFRPTIRSTGMPKRVWVRPAPSRRSTAMRLPQATRCLRRATR